MAEGIWRVWVDTGGTFTDCVAVDSQGRYHQAKVLSASCLRLRIAERVGARQLRLAAGPELPDGFFRGCGFRLLRAGGAAGSDAEAGSSDRPAGAESADRLAASGSPVSEPAATVPVTGYRSAGRVLELASPAPAGAVAGAACELQSPEEAPVLAARLVTGTPTGEALPPLALRLATTRGTNALLERRGSPTAFFVTRGFGDLLAIGSQQRPDLFALEVVKPRPLPAAVVEVDERLAADGSVVRPLDLEAARREAPRLLAAGIRVAAVALLHAYRNPEHEERLAEWLLAEGFRHVSRSAALAPRIKILPRAESAVIDAYLWEALEEYVERVRRPLAAGGGSLHLMTSAGSLVGADGFHPKDGLLSGPAGGVVGAVRAGRASGRDRLLAFDMGGTSTDVSRYGGGHDYVFETRVGEARLMAPALAIETVAAGGGSICRFDGEQLKVGPESAGARPGPACYGAGGPLTLTDVNLLLGRLDPDGFEIPVSVEAAAAAAERLRQEIGRGLGAAPPLEPLLEGCLRIADERMAEAVRRISIRRGYRPADHTLVAFGGAGGQHACRLAEILEVGSVLVPRDASLLSARGLGAARVERFVTRQVLEPLERLAPRLGPQLEEMAAEAVSAVAGEGVPRARIEVRRRMAALRFVGQEATISLECGEIESLRERFLDAYERRYGYRGGERPVEVESLRVVASSVEAEEAPPEPRSEPAPAPVATARRLFVDGSWRDVPGFRREELRRGTRFAGPAQVVERHSATLVAAGWQAEVDAAGALVLTRGDREPVSATSGSEKPASSGDEAGPVSRGAGRGGRRGDGSEDAEAVERELFAHRFVAVAQQMGEMLRRTAVSVNVKERLDFSCAVLDPEGRLVVNAPHIPVHLGALGLCVRSVAGALALGPGDVAVTNHPAFGGSHLPDVTVITPVFAPGQAGEPAASSEPRLLAYVASRAHHAEIGGSRPGSMPPDAGCLAEEGVVIAPRYLVRAGEARWEEISELLSAGPHPTRALEENLADLAAAAAANRRGADALAALAAEHGPERLGRYMRLLAAQSADRVGAAFERLGDGRYAARERLDDGSPLAATVEVAGGRAVIDFAGSAGVHPGNLNATPAIVRSVVLYVLRLLVAEELPLNEGLLERVELRIPRGILNPPFPDDPRQAPAVVGGNVETSQRLVDTLLKALGVAACSQGTMNNLLFGTDRFGYYETVCGGCGAGPGFDGADAVHSHMTNTAATDPEVMEHRYPVRLERFAVRTGSGGRGRHRGGDGAVRELVFLAPVSVSALGQHRVERPYGLAGGEPGRPGRLRLVRRDGETLEIPGSGGCEAAAGDRLILETPGGGGWGEPAGGGRPASEER